MSPESLEVREVGMVCCGPIAELFVTGLADFIYLI
jgi:hypothetical protein